MRVKLAYGKKGLEVELPSTTTVIKSKHVEGLKDEIGGIKKSIENPIGVERLKTMVKEGSKVAIVVSDITRPVPSDKILPPLLEEMSVVDKKNIVIINATGAHRPNTYEELCEMLGKSIVDNYNIINHDAFDEESLTCIGKNDLGHDVWINKAYMDADVKILTGFIEPHFFAGFSGGRKSVLPGIIGQENLKINHGAPMIDSPMARYGLLECNPIHEDMLSTAKKAGVDFIVNVTLNSEHEITGVFSGDLEKAHEEGVEFVKSTAMQKVPELYDVVITTNSGYPLDMNLYQGVKGMAAAEGIIKSKGSIIMAAECSDGIGSDEFYELLASKDSPAQLLKTIRKKGFYVDAQWQVQVLARILKDFNVYLYSDCISCDVATDCHLVHTDSIEKTVIDLKNQIGSAIKIAVMPEGPMTIPYVE